MSDNSLSSSWSQYTLARISHWDSIAIRQDRRSTWGRYYHRRLSELYRFLIPPGQRILEIGCGRGDLLAALKPAIGVGVDFSEEMIKRASARHPKLRFVCGDAHELNFDEQFDIVILSDLLNDLWDVQAALEKIAAVCGPQSRLIINSYSRMWQLALAAAQRSGLATPLMPQNWLTVEDIRGLLCLAGFETIRTWGEIICPLAIPLLAEFANRYLVKISPFDFFALTNFVVARPAPQAAFAKPTVSIIVPARNEAGNISGIFTRTPTLGAETELVFVEGHSKDDTYSSIEREIARHPERKAQLVRQQGMGKGDAVRQGFSRASGDILMILDADLAVPPESLARFYDALVSGRGDFVNGVRLVYPMEKQAMRFLNLVGNKVFTLAFSWLLGQSVKDTLCGTKALWRRDYQKIAASRAYFGDFDPFGDFDLLFGGAKLNLKIIDLPIRYHERTYGATNIQRWRHGWLLLKMVLFAARRIKFV